MDLGAEAWLVLAFVLPLLVIIAFVLLRRAKPSRNAKIAISIVVIALLAAYTIWNLFFRQ